MGHRMRVKANAMRKLMNAKPLKMKHVHAPFRIVVDEILTGYLGEKMHEELYQLKKHSKRQLKWD